MKEIMISGDEYLTSWLYYALGGLILCGCWWFLIKRIPSMLVKLVLHVIVAIAIFFPWFTSPESDFLSPAWLIVAVEGLTDGVEGIRRAGFPLLVALAVSVVLTVIIYLSVVFFKKQKSSNQGSSTSNATRKEPTIA